MATVSMASLLKRQSPSMSYGHGWIMGENGKRWHPVFCTKNSMVSGSKLKEVNHGYRS
ncbi:phage filamentation protein Fil family protein [Erwinia sp.]|uniref:phage filamentation protein Fil family protein n=1 Tax=Erwinia citreus TaxID=558 RepID=UPI0028A14446|nr:phage filamentation protein Fil family protein [Erwinia sp.]